MPRDRWRLRIGFLVAAILFASTPRAHAEPPAVSAPGRHQDAIPQGPSVDARLLEIQRRVQIAVRYPASARERGAEGEARVAFEIAADGFAREVKTEQSSGSLTLDRAATRAVRDAGRLPALSGRITVPVRFVLSEAAPAPD